MDTGIVDQDIGPATEFCGGIFHHRFDLVGFGQIRAIVMRGDAKFGFKRFAGGLDFVLVAKAVEHDIRPGPCKGLGHGKTDAAGRSGNKCAFACQHDVSPCG